MKARMLRGSLRLFIATVKMGSISRMSVPFLFCLTGITFALPQIAPTSTATSTPSTSLPETNTPVTSLSWPTLPAQFDDIPKPALNCWEQRASWELLSHYRSSTYWEGAGSTYITLPTRTTSTGTTSTSWTVCSYFARTAPTTLCDGVPRVDTAESTCSETTSTQTYSIIGDYSEIYIEPTGTLTIPPEPMCTEAADYSNECSRLSDAFKYRMTQMYGSEVTDWNSYYTDYATPTCRILKNKPGPSDEPICRFGSEGARYEAYYWPTPVPTGSAFCANASTTATPTGPLQTAVVSGFTLTSPTIYHFVYNVSVSTSAGVLDHLRSRKYTTVWLPTAVPTLLTLAQLEADVYRVTQSKRIKPYNHGQYYTPMIGRDFRTADLTSVRSNAFTTNWMPGTIVQDWYRPEMVVKAESLTMQNGVLSDCSWYTSRQPVPMTSFEVPTAAFHALAPIATETLNGGLSNSDAN